MPGTAKVGDDVTMHTATRSSNVESSVFAAILVTEVFKTLDELVEVKKSR